MVIHYLAALRKALNDSEREQVRVSNLWVNLNSKKTQHISTYALEGPAVIQYDKSTQSV